MDFSRGRFKGKTYQVEFEFFGHVMTDENFFISKFSAKSLGFSALVVLDDFTPQLPNYIDNNQVWTCTDKVILTQFMTMLAKHNIDLQGKVIRSLSANVLAGNLTVSMSFCQPGSVPCVPFSVRLCFPFSTRIP